MANTVRRAHRNIYNKWVLTDNALRIHAILSDDDVEVHDGAVWLRFQLTGSAEPISPEETARLDRVLDRNRHALLSGIIGAQIGSDPSEGFDAGLRYGKARQTAAREKQEP